MMELNTKQNNFLKSMTTVFWWKKPDELLEYPLRTLAGVMDMGTLTDWVQMEKLFSRETVIEVLESAECGEFHGWSWTFWRGRYGLNMEKPLPARFSDIDPPSGDDWYKSMQNNAEDNPDDPAIRLEWTAIYRDI